MLLVSFPLHPDIYSLPSGRGNSFSPAGAGGIGTGAATSSKCSSTQIDIGGTCTSKAEVSKQIVSITQGVMKKDDAKGVVLRVDFGNDTVVNTGLGDSQVGVPVTPDMKWRPGLDGDPDAHDSRAAAAGAGQAQPRRHALEVVPRVPQRRQGDVADALERHLRLPRLHPGEPAVPGRAARGAVPPVDRRRAAQLRVRAAGRLRPGRVLPLRAHQLHPARQRDREDHRQVGDRADAAEFLDPLGLTETKITKLPAIPEPALHAYTSERGVYEESTGWSPSWGLGDGLIMTSTCAT